MMATGMANLWQCVVFRIDTDESSPCATDCFKSSLNPICFSSDGKSLSFEKIANGIMSNKFFEAKLWIVVNLGMMSARH